MTSTLCASSELDAIVLRFLKDRQHEKTAKLYLKALNKTTVDISKVDDLLTIYNFYQANLENMKNSGGCDESDSDSSDSDDDKSDDESGNQINDSIHAPPKLSTVISSNESDSDSDSDDSSSSGSSSSTNSSESSVKPHPKRQNWQATQALLLLRKELMLPIAPIVLMVLMILLAPTNPMTPMILKSLRLRLHAGWKCERKSNSLKLQKPPALPLSG